MTTRRDFIRNTSVLAAGSAFLSVNRATAYPLRKDFMNAGEDEFWKLVRASFPLNQKPLYLNNGTMGPSPFSVIEAQYNSMMEVDSTGTYGGWEEAVPALARFVKANENEICLTRNVTEGINIVCWGLNLKKGDEVIITNHEHVGNALPWLNRAKLDGIVLKPVSLAPTAAETLNRINSLITKRTKVIAVPHIPCTQGQVLPAKEICALAKEKGIYSFIDGAHGPGMLTLDLHDMGCDFYASCCHKWLLGPKGTGFLYVKHERLNELQASWVGGYCDTGWDLTCTPPILNGYVDTAHRYYYGSMNASIYRGVVEAVNFHEMLGRERVELRVKELAGYFYKKLQAMDGKVEIMTPDEETSRAAMVGFKINKLPGDDFYQRALKAGIRIRYVAENGLNLHRASFHIYNSFDDADKLAALVQESA